MHPATRYGVADSLKVKLFGKKYSGDPHAEAWAIINNSFRGLQVSASHFRERVNPVSKSTDWYQCLFRTASEIYPSETSSETKGIYESRNTLDECKNSSSVDIQNLEFDLLKNMAGSVHNSAISDAKLEERVNQVLLDPELQSLANSLKQGNLDDQTIFVGLIELCFLIYRETIKYEQGQHQKIREKQIKREQKYEVKAKKINKSDANTVEPVFSDVVPDKAYDLSATELLTAIKVKLLAGTWDPRGVGSASNALARKAGSVVSGWAIQHFILIPFVPFLIIPFIVYRFALKPFFGSHLQNVYLAVAQMLLQRVLLSVYGINIDRFY